MATKEIVTAAILAAATENSRLLNELSATIEAPRILQGHLVRIESLQVSLAEQESSLQALRVKTEEQLSSHKKFRDSRIRKLYYRATQMLAKFEARATHQEQSYFEALKEQARAEARQSELKQDLDRAKTEKRPLEAAAKEHELAHKRIDELYESLYAGLTPGFAHEDKRERAFYETERTNNATKDSIIGARKVRRLLEQVAKKLKSANVYMKLALEEVKNTLFLLDGAISLAQLGNTQITYALSDVDRAAEYLETSEAIGVQHKLAKSFGLAQVDSTASYTRATLSATITYAQGALDQAATEIDRLKERAKAQEEQGLMEIKQTARKMEDARQALQQVRQGIFEEVAGFGEAAPAYSECCDRADSFCSVPTEPAGAEEGEEAPPGYGSTTAASSQAQHAIATVPVATAAAGEHAANVEQY